MSSVSNRSTNEDQRYLRVLTDPWYRALIDIQDIINRSTAAFFSQRQLKTLHLPITTQAISSPMGLGSDSKPVEVDLFGVKTFLADSMQFMLEYGCRLHAQGCYYLMPSFRGENADETHLCQFYHSEAEIPGSIDDVMNLVEDYLRHMSTQILAEASADTRTALGDTSHVESLVQASQRFPRVTMDEAERIVGRRDEYMRVREPRFRALTREGERLLMRQFGGIVWLTEQDHLAVPFYQAFADPARSKAKASDLLLGLGELVGAGERHSTAADVYDALAMHHVDGEPYGWYCELRRRFPMQTAGFGLGIERYICWLLKHNDIRDCQILPRYNGVLTIP